MGHGLGPSSVLQHKYISQAGREQGSIAASIFVSEQDGKPDGRWTAAEIYEQKASTHVKPDGQKYARYEGYIESQPGTFFGIVLQWRSKSGALTKSWKLDDDLVAYYYLDGRALPCMRYAIYQPGGKNPLPLSGLWPDNVTRYPLKWAARQENDDSVNPTDDLYISSHPNLPVPPPLASIDDFSSIRITVHHKTDEEANKNKKESVESPMPHNQGVSVHEETTQYYDESYLTEQIDLDTPRYIAPEELKEIFSGREAPANALPFLEFRIYYKSRATLESLGICDPPRVNGTVNGHKTNGHAQPELEDSDELPPPLKRTVERSGTNHTKRRRLSEEESMSPAAAAPAPDARIAPPPLSESSSASAGPSVHSASPVVRQAGGDAALPTARQAKAEPQSSPRGMEIDEDAEIESEAHEQGSAAANGKVDTFASPGGGEIDISQGPAKPAQARPKSGLQDLLKLDGTALFDTLFGTAPATHLRDTTPIASTSAIPTDATAMMAAAVAKAEQRSPQMPALSSQKSTTTVKLDSPMPSPVESLEAKIQSSKTSNASRWALAQAFLEEEELDIAEDEYIYALLQVGFRNKAKFLSQLPKCDATTREGIFEKLQSFIPALDYGVLRSYIQEHCNV